MLRWGMLSGWLMLLSGTARADSRLERSAEHQRLARAGLIIAAISPVFVLSASAMEGEGQGVERTSTAAVGVAGTAVGLTLLGRRSMRAAASLDLSGGGGAVTLCFDIAAVAAGTHYAIAGQNPTSGMSYLVASAGGLVAGGLQLRQNRFIAEMRTDPRVMITPTGVAVVGQF